MSESAPQSPTTAVDDTADRRKSIGKYVKRLSSVLRRGSSKSSVPKVTTAPALSPASPSAAPREATEITAIETPAEESPTPVPATNEPLAITTSAGPSNVPGAYARSAVQQERARALFAKYGLTLEAHEWITSGPTVGNVQRVEKPIRMRVHRVCHRCNNTFGADRVCTKCEHKRCKKCPRYPTKKPKDGMAPKEVKGKENEPPKEDEAVTKKRKKNQLSRTTKAGTEVVYQPVRQRVRRTCHKCDTLFPTPAATTCEKCQHQRCTKCPREPPKLKKWPNGYPGDAPYVSSDEEPLKTGQPERAWRKSRLRVRWTCSECSNQFSEGSKVCENCSHERCDKCTRIPLKKEKKEFDPEVVKRVEERMKAIGIQNPPTSI